MRVGVISEIKHHEYRVGLTPACAQAYAAHGHEVLVQAGAGIHAGFGDADYLEAGARILPDAAAVCATADMVVKVKEPQPQEWPLLRRGQILFTYLHLAAEPGLTRALQNQGVRAVAYETIALEDGSLPCLRPMSEIAGRLAPQEGAKYLEKTFGGRGVLLAGVTGVQRGRVVILGAGVAGTSACLVAVGMGAQVTVLDIRAGRLAALEDVHGSRIQTLYATDHNVDMALRDADVVIGAVLVPGARAPRIVRREHLRRMRRGAVLVDISIDQGGCFETSRPTTHDEPIYIEEGIVHYCVTNMPGAVSLTSTLALTSSTLPYGLALADHGIEAAVRSSPALAAGVNVYDGAITCRGVAEAMACPHTPVASLLGLRTAQARG